jgi:hypothetical protein
VLLGFSPGAQLLVINATSGRTMASAALQDGAAYFSLALAPSRTFYVMRCSFAIPTQQVLQFRLPAIATDTHPNRTGYCTPHESSCPPMMHHCCIRTELNWAQTNLRRFFYWVYGYNARSPTLPKL